MRTWIATTNCLAQPQFRPQIKKKKTKASFHWKHAAHDRIEQKLLHKMEKFSEEKDYYLWLNNIIIFE